MTAVPFMNPNTDLVVTSELESCGLVSYWRCSEGMSLSSLADRFTEEGLDPALLPKAPDDITALGRAVAEQGGKRRLVRPLARRGIWAVVDETVVENQPPTYRTLVTVSMVAGIHAVAPVDATKEELSKLYQDIFTAYKRHQATLDGSDISSWLISLAKARSAVTLRDTGGIYFVPREHSDFWRSVARCVEATPGFRVFRIPAMRNAECVAAIVDAVSAEAAALVDTMEAELMATGDDELGKRALKTRQTQAEALLAKVVDYEKLLGLQLDVRARVEELSAKIVSAALA